MPGVQDRSTGEHMHHWDLTAVDVAPRQPQILTTTDHARAILVGLEAGRTMSDHEVHENAWVSVVEGEIEMTATASGEQITAGPGSLFEFAPAERHSVAAKTDARLLLLLAPWPGDGHPGATPPAEKAQARERAAERRAGSATP